MEIGVIFFVIVACAVCASVVYVSMEYRLYGERREGLDKLLKVQTEVAAKQKQIDAFSKYTDYLPAAKKHAIEHTRTLTTKITREYAYNETFQKEPMNLSAVVTVAVRQSAQYTFGIELKAEEFDVHMGADCIEVMAKKPTLIGSPTITTLSHDVSVPGVLKDEQAVLKDIKQKCLTLARHKAPQIASEEAVLALCEKKLVAVLREFLVQQPDVVQLPGISVMYR